MLAKYKGTPKRELIFILKSHAEGKIAVVVFQSIKLHHYDHDKTLLGNFILSTQIVTLIFPMNQNIAIWMAIRVQCNFRTQRGTGAKNWQQEGS